jgi:hypothetical protein
MYNRGTSLDNGHRPQRMTSSHGPDSPSSQHGHLRSEGHNHHRHRQVPPTRTRRPSIIYASDDGIEESSEDQATRFLAEHTDFLSHSDTSNPPNSECPICLEGIEDHICVKITGIEGCDHLIGLTCLQELLEHSPDAEKSCPLCRKTWIAEEGIWQGSDAWNALASGNTRSGIQSTGRPSTMSAMTSMPSIPSTPSIPSIPAISAMPTMPPLDDFWSDSSTIGSGSMGPMFGGFGPMGGFGLSEDMFIAATPSRPPPSMQYGAYTSRHPARPEQRPFRNEYHVPPLSRNPGPNASYGMQVPSHFRPSPGFSRVLDAFHGVVDEGPWNGRSGGRNTRGPPQGQGRH